MCPLCTPAGAIRVNVKPVLFFIYFIRLRKNVPPGARNSTSIAKRVKKCKAFITTIVQKCTITWQVLKGFKKNFFFANSQKCSRNLHMIRCTKSTNIVQLNNCQSTDTPRILGHLISAAPIATAKNPGK